MSRVEQAEAFKDGYKIVVVFERELSDDADELDCGDKYQGADLATALISQFRDELQDAYDHGGVAGNFDIVGIRLTPNTGFPLAPEEPESGLDADEDGEAEDDTLAQAVDRLRQAAQEQDSAAKVQEDAAKALREPFRVAYNNAIRMLRTKGVHLRTQDTGAKHLVGDTSPFMDDSDDRTVLHLTPTVWIEVVIGTIPGKAWGVIYVYGEGPNKGGTSVQTPEELALATIATVVAHEVGRS